MKEYCVDLEIAKELKENGFPQKSVGYWVWDNYNQCNFVQLQALDEDELLCSAPTSDEILKELPKYIETDGYLYKLEILPMETWNYVGYSSNSKTILIEKNNKKLSNTLSEVWLFLKKEGYIK